MTVFIDTSAFIALLIAEDESHQAAVNVWTKLVQSDQQLTTTNYVVTETCALLQRRADISSIRTLAEDILPVVLVEWVDVNLHMAGMNSVLMSSKGGPSLVDCISFAAMRKLKTRQVFTFDKHFSGQGFDVIR